MSQYIEFPTTLSGNATAGSGGGGGGSGVTTVGTIDSQPASTDGASISGSSIYLQTATSGNTGLVSTSGQVWRGPKTILNSLIIGSSAGFGAGSLQLLAGTTGQTVLFNFGNPSTNFQMSCTQGVNGVTFSGRAVSFVMDTNMVVSSGDLVVNTNSVANFMAPNALTWHNMVYQSTSANYVLAQNDSGVILDLAVMAASITITAPASPKDGHVMRIVTGPTSGGLSVQTPTIAANAGQTISGASTALYANSEYAWQYRLTNTNWYRLKNGG